MLEIFVCEDENLQRELLTEFVKDYISFENLDMTVRMSVDNPQEIIEYIRNNKTTGLYFLDVDLQTSINGIELADEIRKYDKRGAIVFVTNFSESLSIAMRYGVEAMGFITKHSNFNEMKEEITTNIKRAQERLIDGTGKHEKRFTFHTRTGLISEPYDSIMFFETYKVKKNRIIMVCENRTINFSGSISKIEKQHPHFIKFDQSTLINPDNILETLRSEGEIKMKNGDSVRGTERRIGKFHASLKSRDMKK